jgi:hypothetical protein
MFPVAAFVAPEACWGPRVLSKAVTVVSDAPAKAATRRVLSRFMLNPVVDVSVAFAAMVWLEDATS